MSKDIWRDCKKQPPLVDDGELVLMDSNDKFWVGFCKITPDGVFYFANNAEPLKNDFVKYARIEKLLAVESELELTRKALDIAVDMLTRIVVSPETMMEPEKVVPQLADLALKQITALEQKDVK